MPFRFAIASGKGGTGKTTVAVNLYRLFGEAHNKHVELVDCDVEEPNDLIFFSNAQKLDQDDITQMIPRINKEACTFCRDCVTYCEFNAIVIIPTVRYAEVKNTLCHSCGACLIACKQGAMTEHAETIGWVNSYQTNVNGLKEGRLKIGSTMQTMLIKNLKKKVSATVEIVIYDAPPGTSCSVVETISDANYVILVAEPTLFGLHDLKLMVSLLREVNIPFGVILNKIGLGNSDVHAYIATENIEFLGELPFSKEYASSYAQGIILEHLPEKLRLQYDQIIETLSLKIKKRNAQPLG